MWTWSLNWGEITPRILVGTCPKVPADLGQIRAAAVSAVLSLQHDECLAYWRIDEAQMRTHGEKLGLRMERSPMRDFDHASLGAIVPDDTKDGQLQVLFANAGLEQSSDSMTG